MRYQSDLPVPVGTNISRCARADRSENVHSLKKWRNHRGLQDFHEALPKGLIFLFCLTYHEQHETNEAILEAIPPYPSGSRFSAVLGRLVGVG